MKKFFLWTGFVVASLAGIALLGAAYLYFASERELARQFTAHDDAALVVPDTAADVEEGRRLALLGGCHDCHGENLAGRLVDDIPFLVRLVAPNISTALPAYDDAQLATVLRKGVKPDGKSVAFMPSEQFRHLSDQDLGRLIAYLRTVPATAEGVQEQTELRILGRLILVKGDVKVAAAAIESLPEPVRHFDAEDSVSHGRYLVMNFCSECHGQDLQGFPAINAPPLAVAKGYALEQFEKLLQHGDALGDRDLRIMGPTSRARFAHFTRDEIAAVHAYLHSL